MKPKNAPNSCNEEENIVVDTSSSKLIYSKVKISLMD